MGEKCFIAALYTFFVPIGCMIFFVIMRKLWEAWKYNTTPRDRIQLFLFTLWVTTLFVLIGLGIHFS